MSSILMLIMPVETAGGYMDPCAFWMTELLATVAYQFAMAEKFPDAPSFTAMDKFFSACYAITTLEIVGSIIRARLLYFGDMTEDQNQEVEIYSALAFTVIYIIAALCLLSGLTKQEAAEDITSQHEDKMHERTRFHDGMDGISKSVPSRFGNGHDSEGSNSKPRKGSVSSVPFRGRKKRKHSGMDANDFGTAIESGNSPFRI
mmetsp:Transcript_107744/g.313617  ORF Transcript_107744/g.313617 Transcript_107744/m.313617 type:complete len:203 (+) Transcript_107744:161-769(+)